MAELSDGERDLVALGAALGSNCVPCVEHYVSEARNAGLTDRQIVEAIRMADGVRRVPAQQVLDAALGLIPKTASEEVAGMPEAKRTAADPDGTPNTPGTTSQPAGPDPKPCCC